MKLGAIGAVTVSLMFAGASLAGCSSGGGTASPTATPPSSSSAPTGSASATGVPTEYTAEMEETFVTACVQAAGTNGTTEADAKAICGCTYRGIEKKIPFKDYAKADADAASGAPVPKVFTDIRDECNNNPSAY